MTSWIDPRSIFNDANPLLLEWRMLYREVVEVLGIDPHRDLYASHILEKMVDRCPLIPKPFTTSIAIVVGAGPSLEKLLGEARHFIRSYPVVAADGATKALLEANIVPYAIATDLDGDPNAVIEACSRGSIVFLHAHGDNVDKLLTHGLDVVNHCRYVVPTTQCPRAPPPLVNVGGFTDGDRCCTIAYSLGFEKLVLLGMDLNSDYVGRYSKGFEVRAWIRKRLKLSIARRIIDGVAKRIEVIEIGSCSLTYSRCVPRWESVCFGA